MNKKFPNVEIRKILALLAAAVLAFATVWALVKGLKEYTLMLLPAWIGVINSYFAKSTALDKPGQ